MQAATIQEVVDGLTAEVQRCREQKDRAGYFASLYRQVTVAIQRDVAAGKFDDNPRMERFDAAFGSRYFTALTGWRSNDPDHVPVTWREAFNATRRPDLAVVQHLVLGVNAHINVDLAVATTQAVNGKDIQALKSDFDRINDILISVLDQIQGVLNSFSPAAAIIDAIGGRLDEKILGFSVKRSRGAAWDAAVVLASLPDEAGRERVEGMLDSTAQGLGRLVLESGRLVYRLISPATATLDVDEVIDRLEHATG